MLPSQEPKIPFTQEAYEKMQQDFERFTLERAEVMERLKIAREMGDLSENGAYRYAKFELGNIGRQLRQLEYLLKHGEVVVAQEYDRVGFGTAVTVLSGDDKEVTYLIVSKHESNPKAGKLSMESPIGRALLGKKVGESVSVDIPAGAVTYRIVQITGIKS